MAKFIFGNTKRKVLFIAAKIDFWGQNGVRALEPSLMGFDVMSCIHVRKGGRFSHVIIFILQIFWPTSFMSHNFCPVLTEYAHYTRWRKQRGPL